jgi:hypothetical protein
MNIEGYELIDAKQIREGDLVLRKKEVLPEIPKKYLYSEYGLVCSNNYTGNLPKPDSFRCSSTAEACEYIEGVERLQRAINRACNLADPDFRPDYANEDEEKSYVYFDFTNNKFQYSFNWYTTRGSVVVSSKEKAEYAIRILKHWGVSANADGTIRMLK